MRQKKMPRLSRPKTSLNSPLLFEAPSKGTTVDVALEDRPKNHDEIQETLAKIIVRIWKEKKNDDGR